MPKNPIRVRIAPSPTGNLHIGTAHTALFNWLFARKENGSFILRIEDTDLERSDAKFEKDIIDGLRWLGLTWDEGPDIGGPYGPYRQSERLEIYEKYIKELLSGGFAYYCACSKEELEEERRDASAGKTPQIYSGKCRSKNLKTGELIRFKMPPGKTAFKDLIRGDIAFDGELIGDFAIAKGPRVPLYNFAVVVDDIEMKITHVIRGEDHIANTPKQLAIIAALGKTAPEYGHLPLILDNERAKLSKRFSAVSIDEYKKDGFLEDALVNFLALLGWHPEGDVEIMDRAELRELFSLERVQKAGAVFDIEKLKWMNSQYIKKLATDDLIVRIKDTVPTLNEKNKSVGDGAFKRFIEISRDRAQTLQDFETETAFLFTAGEYPRELLVWKKSTASLAKENLLRAQEFLQKFPGDFTKVNLEPGVMALATEHGRGEVLWPLRVSLSGLEKSPGPFELLEALGKVESLTRIDAALKKLG